MPMKGRPPAEGVAREAYLRVRLTEYESERLDLQRGELSRSDFVRSLLKNHARRNRVG